MRLTPVFSCLIGLALLASACRGSYDARKVEIVQTDEGCTPTSFTARTGEKLTLVVKNNGGEDREIEGIEGTQLEEVVVPSGATREIPWTASGSPGTAKLKCYSPRGTATVIEVTLSPS